MTTKNIQFNIIEGIDETDLFEAIKEDYYNTNLSVEEIRNKHDVSLTKWRTLFIKRLKENNLPLRKKPKGKYYYWDKNRGMFKVQRHIKNKPIFFGYYSTEEEVKERIEELNRNGWEGYL